MSLEQQSQPQLMTHLFYPLVLFFIFLLILFFKYVFIYFWLHWVLAAARGIIPCGVQASL